MHRRLRPSVLFAMMQEAAIAHTEELGMGRSKTLDKGLLWVVTLQSAEINRMPEYRQELTLRSWAGKSLHLIFPRYFELCAAEGNTLVRASALWSLIDEKSRSIAFPEKHGIVIEGVQTGRELPLPGFIKGEPSGFTRDFTVPYSYVDLNGHMSNTRYLDLAEDCIYSSTKDLRLKSIRTEYAREIRLGDTVKLSWEEENGRYFFSGNMDKNCFKLVLEYE